MALRIAWVIVIGLALAGCSIDDFWENYYKGTTKGFAYCKIAGEKQGLSSSVVQNYCAERHEKNIEANISGQAGYSTSFGSGFGGNVENKSTTHIITSYTILISHRKAAGGETKTFSMRWMPPGHSDYFYIPEKELKYFPVGEDQKHEHFGWNIVRTRGIEIKL